MLISLLTAFAKNELSKEITWDILLAIASKKYGEMELKKLRSKKKKTATKTPKDPNDMDDDEKYDTKINDKETKTLQMIQKI